jgi:hypothetical protein
MDAQAVQLGADDYQVLQSMLVSDDAKLRERGQGIAKKLTSDEQQEFFTFQKQATTGRDAQSQRADSAVVSGVPVIGSVNPEDLLAATAAGRTITRAVKSAGTGTVGAMAAGLKQAAIEATPVVKYEATRTALKAMGAPDLLASSVAMIVSGYRFTKPEPTPSGLHLDRSVPARASDLTPQQLRERIVSGYGTPTAVESPLELTRRLKAENQARLAATSPAESVSGGTPLPSGPPPESVPVGTQAAPAAAPAAPKVKVPAAQMKEYIALRQRGMTHEQAVNAIQAALAFQQRFGTPTPTAQETRFPKGMRGKASGAAGMHGEGEPE